MFIATSAYSHTYIYSYDGKKWEVGEFPSLYQCEEMCYGDGKFVALSLYENVSISSPDGIIWTKSIIDTDRCVWGIYVTEMENL